ncbi:PREDICTED: uncharacterized protein LOC104586941 isoform X2 [Nelumbo nucifera]|uniref:Uncharacterized protein LOC104586941 isoform X2 n=1 Tax=Nelumbo nucifera TaxID=4432 RepID=A0A1U7YX96_NELNU|nr:PREDICTED: uncharacterized protein LOC104586941 isoform X2 [Nelumbo nucifera]
MQIPQAGFPSPPQPNSLLLFNCFNRTKSFSPFLRNCTHLHDCGPYPKQEPQGISSCLFVHDSEKLEMGFDPKDLGCSHYNRVYRDTSTEGFQLGTRVSFDIPDHVPNICSECTKPKGNCGVGLRCICHPKQCKDKVFSGGISTNPSLLSIIIMVVLFMSC